MFWFVDFFKTQSQSARSRWFPVMPFYYVSICKRETNRKWITVLPSVFWFIIANGTLILNVHIVPFNSQTNYTLDTKFSISKIILMWVMLSLHMCAPPSVLQTYVYGEHVFSMSLWHGIRPLTVFTNNDDKKYSTWIAFKCIPFFFNDRLCVYVTCFAWK